MYFCFKVTDKTDPYYIDGEDVKQSNWLRYVNCARTKQEQNCEAYQYRGHIYYKTLREITVGQCNIIVSDIMRLDLNTTAIKFAEWSESKSAGKFGFSMLKNPLSQIFGAPGATCGV